MGGVGGSNVTVPVRISSLDALMSDLQGVGGFTSRNTKFTCWHRDAVLSR